MSDQTRPTIIGSPLYPTTRDSVHLVEGALGNTLLVPNRVAESGSDFYVLFAADRGKNPAEVADLIRKQHALAVRTFQDPGKGEEVPGETVALEINVDPAAHHHVLDPDVRDQLRFRPDLGHLAFKYGDNADYYMIACHFRLEDHERLFGDESRRIVDESGESTGQFLNARKFDLLFSSAKAYVGGDQGDLIPDVIHRGGLAIYDRTNPDGDPTDFYVARLSDVHVAKAHDNLQLEVIRRGDGDLYVRFGNPNENFAAIIERLNRDYREGRVDLVTLMGDNVDHDGTDHEVSSDLTNSNTLLLSHFLTQISAPVLVMKGNHDSLAEEPPGSVMAENYQISKAEADSLQSKRYWGIGGMPIFGPLVGQAQKLADALGSVLYNPRALRPYYHMVNPFDDMILTLEGGEGASAALKSVRMVFLDTGPNDLAHWRQDDDIYYDQLQKLWPWQLPFMHPESTIELITGRSPDLLGPSKKQLTWLAGRSFQYLVGHAPLLDSEAHEGYEADETRPLEPLKDAGPYERNNFGTMWHNGRELVLTLLQKPEFIAYIGGHGHKHGHAGLFGVDSHNRERILRGPVLETLNRIPEENREANLRAFWKPDETSPPDVWAGLNEFYGTAGGDIRGKKFYWQAGSATIGIDPAYSVMTITPEGYIARDKNFYPVKEIVADPDDPTGNRYFLRYTISDSPLGANTRLVEKWRRIKRNKPTAFLDFDRQAKRIAERRRLRTELLVPHPNALKSYAEPLQAIERPLISDTKVNRHYDLRLLGNTALTDGHNLGVQLERLFSQYELGYIARSVLIQGLEAGWFRDENGDDRFHLAWTSPDILDWKIPDVVTIRGPGFSVGPEYVLRHGEDDRFRIHNEMRIVEAAFRRNNSPWELSVGIRKPDIFVGEADLVYTVGLDRAF